MIASITHQIVSSNLITFGLVGRESRYLSVDEANQNDISSDFLVTGKEFTKIINKKSKAKHEGKLLTKYLDPADVIDICIRSDQSQRALLLINLLYPDIHKSNKGCINLLKVLIHHERIDIFEAIFCDQEQNNEYEEYSEARSDNDYSDLISDAFATAILDEKYFIAFYLFQTFTEDIFENKIPCLDVLTNSFKNDSYDSNRIMYLEERLFILLKLVMFIKYEMAIDFLDAVKNIMKFEKSDHFLVHSVNPIKLIVMLIEIFNEIKMIHPMLTFKVDEVNKILSKSGNQIIWQSHSIRDVEDLLFDRTYDQETILDCIARINVVDFLENTIVENIVTNIYYGNYQREAFYKKSIVFKTCLYPDTVSARIKKLNPLLLFSYSQHSKRK